MLICFLIKTIWLMFEKLMISLICIDWVISEKRYLCFIKTELVESKCKAITRKRLWHGGWECDLCYFYNDSGFVRTCDYKDIGKENLHDNRPSASFLGSSRLPLTTTILLPFSTILHLWRFSTCCNYSSQCSKYVSKCDSFILSCIVRLGKKFNISF